MNLAQALQQLANFCTCGTKKARDEGFTYNGVDWVCAQCNQPTRMYANNVILPRILKEHN